MSWKGDICLQRRTKKDLELLAGETLLDYFIRHTLMEKDERNIVQVLAHMNGLVFSKTDSKRRRLRSLVTIFYLMGWKKAPGMKGLSVLEKMMRIS